MKFLSLLFLACLLQCSSIAQKISPADFRVLQQKEDSLKAPAMRIIQGINPLDRFVADSIFTRIFMRALKIKNSFYYPFDSLITISCLYAPDSSFRIITWQMLINDNIIRQHGAIQMHTADGSLMRYPLIDKSDVTVNMEDTVGNHFGWMGAVYYRIILKKYNNHSYYTLIGYDENNIRSNKKIIEVLDFVDGEPRFGGRFFSIPGSGIKPRNPSRYIMEFKKEASPRLNYDKELDMIVMEHLISESNSPDKKYTLVGDGDYEGLKWINGKWVHVSKIFNEVTPEGGAPVPNPLSTDKDKTISEKKLSGEDETEQPEKKP
ncbi:MAG TPA: hypothetical protein PLC48_01440 [Ferruginibacter sp.]|nr:hypothetical protein [Ferruginibacter sp.]